MATDPTTNLAAAATYSHTETKDATLAAQTRNLAKLYRAKAREKEEAFDAGPKGDQPCEPANDLRALGKRLSSIADAAEDLE